MSKPRILFLGSFLQYSAQVLKALNEAQELEVVGVVTTPPQPAGRKQELTKTHVHQLAEAKGLPIFTPEKLTADALAELPEADIMLTAGYGKLLPASWLAFPKIAALNLHFSLLPKYRGANPAEWALLLDENETGVTVIEMSPEFDTGNIVAQAQTRLTHRDTRESVYEKLYALGGQILPEVITTYVQFKTNGEKPTATAERQLILTLPPQPQAESSTPYAKRLYREDGFVAWSAVAAALEGKTATVAELSPTLQDIATLGKQAITPAWLERAIRALAGFPGVWTVVKTNKGEKRLKLQAAQLKAGRLVLEIVQLEGQASAHWNQIKNSSIT
jgi:methionyl-tRNA formyltransferase